MDRLPCGVLFELEHLENLLEVHGVLPLPLRLRGLGVHRPVRHAHVPLHETLDRQHGVTDSK
jgi:hypothetical protein